jgi:hypothetical protein
MKLTFGDNTYELVDVAELDLETREGVTALHAVSHPEHHPRYDQ